MPRQNGPPPHILLVDDDASVRLVLSNMFESFGYRVSTEAGGEQAIASLARNTFDVVVTDLAMPDMDGLQLVQHISAQHPDTCAVIITGFTDQATFPEVYNAGAVDFIAKPINREELQARIEWVLHQRDIRRQLQKTLEEHRDAQDQARRSLATVSILNQLLHLAVEKKPLDEILDRFILHITSLPWLGLLPKGAILLAGSEPAGLVLKAHRNLAPELITICARVPEGRCLCGLAAARRQVVFANHVDGRHHNTFSGMDDHGHYCVPILAPGGELLGVFTLYVAAGTLYDARVEETLQAAAATMAGIILQHRSEEERNRLREALRQAQKFKALSTMASGLAHEFKNMLTAIRGFASLIKEDAGDRQQIRDDAEQILAVTDRGVAMIRKLQAVSREEASSHAPVRVTPVVREVMEALRDKMPAGVTLQEEYTGSGDTVLGNPAEIHELTSALVSNACKAMRRQGGTLTVRLETVTLGHQAPGVTGRLAPGRWLRLTVADTGIGMTPETVARIFEPYFSASSHEDGAGLGLTIALGIVRAMDGDIIVESTFGKGSTLTVYLPPFVTTPQGTTP